MNQVALYNLSPFELALNLYQAHGKTAEKFYTDLADHLQNAFLYSTPWSLIMGRAVVLDDGRYAWLVTVAVGNLEELVAFCPFKLDWIAFERNGKPPLKVYPFDRFMKLARRHR